MSDKESNKKTEWLSFYCTPKFKKEFEALGDNERLKDKAIRDLFTTELDFVKQECDEIDNHIIRYRAMLLKLKDVFSEHQDLYVDEIETIINSVNSKFKPIESKVDLINTTINGLNSSVERVRDKLNHLPVERLERFNDSLQRFKSFTQDEKDIINLLLSK